jgi:hypothetical protein
MPRPYRRAAAAGRTGPASVAMHRGRPGATRMRNRSRPLPTDVAFGVLGTLIAQLAAALVGIHSVAMQPRPMSSPVRSGSA